MGTDDQDDATDELEAESDAVPEPVPVPEIEPKKPTGFASLFLKAKGSEPVKKTNTVTRPKAKAVKVAKQKAAAKPVKAKAAKPEKNGTPAKPKFVAHPTRGENYTAQAIKDGRRLVTEPMAYQETFRTTEGEHAKLEAELIEANTVAAKKGTRPHRSMAQFLRHKLGFVTAGL